jgi:hypothetical protein
MALQKDIESQYGVILSYWKVTRLNIEWHEKIAEVFMAGWPNQQIRENGVQPLEYKSFVFRHNDWPFTFDGNNVSESYDRLKLPINVHVSEEQGDVDTNPFTGAIDVI